MHEFTKDKWLCPTLTKNFLILILHTSLTNLVGSYLNPWEWTESANQKEEPLVKSKDTTGRLRDAQVTTHEARSLWEALRTPHSEGRLNFDANCKYTKSMLAPQQILTDHAQSTGQYTEYYTAEHFFVLFLSEGAYPSLVYVWF